MNIERLTAAFGDVTPAVDNKWFLHHVAGERLYLSRASDGAFALFITVGPDVAAPLPAGVTRGMVRALPGNEELDVLRITSRNAAHGNRIIAHIAYEMSRQLSNTPDMPSVSLLQQTSWVLALLDRPTESLLGPERQRGLVGECLFLQELLLRAAAIDVSGSTALDRWWGFSAAKRDFAAKGVAIEVKTTGADVRAHGVSSLAQLEPQDPSERVYVYSVGVKTDPSAPRKLPLFIDDVEALLVERDGTPDIEAIERFYMQLLSYGFDVLQKARYEAEPGFLKIHLAGEMYEETALDRLRLTSFIGSKLPSMVSAVSYVLHIMASPLSKGEKDAVIDGLLIAPPLMS